MLWCWPRKLNLKIAGGLWKAWQINKNKWAFCLSRFISGLQHGAPLSVLFSVHDLRLQCLQHRQRGERFSSSSVCSPSLYSFPTRARCRPSIRSPSNALTRTLIPPTHFPLRMTKAKLHLSQDWLGTLHPQKLQLFLMSLVNNRASYPICLL